MSYIALLVICYMGQNVKDAVYFTFSNNIFIFYWNVISGVQKLRQMPMATLFWGTKIRKTSGKNFSGVYVKLGIFLLLVLTMRHFWHLLRAAQHLWTPPIVINIQILLFVNFFFNRMKQFAMLWLEWLGTIYRYRSRKTWLICWIACKMEWC